MLLASTALLMGCPGKSSSECKVDQDCSVPTAVCINGFCRECREDAQCKAPDKPVCRDNACAAQCAANTDCKAGEKCAGAKCVPECTEATAAADCGQGKSCRAGRCTAEEECAADADCGNGKACVQQRCVAQGGAANDKLGECTLQPVYFGYDDAQLTPEARKALSDDWECLRKSPGARVLVAGHTDERGTTEYNLALGMHRADSVRKYLLDLGASADQLKPVSYGKEKPADPGHDESAWSKNRRVELSKGGQ